MKNEKLLFVLVILTLIISIAAYVNSLQAIHRNIQQEELLQSINTLDVLHAAREDFVYGPESELVAENIYHGPQEEPAVDQQADSTPAVASPQPKPKKTEVAQPKPEQEEVQTIVDEDGYIDLGLPSGALWKAQNEDDLMTYAQAKKKYGRSLPALKHWDELTKYCKWEWQNDGYKITGPNGQAIFLPAKGYRNFSGQIGKVGVYGNYWSSTSKNKEEAWRLGFDPEKISLATNNRNYARSVRLIKRESILKEVTDNTILLP